ncbi:diphthine methyl ester synthase [Nomia melanderi]|uniref:diphthine methyl ester synthase n=1 Tax=Nomia melanderi TaxID=2448451 RepID=UPI0013043181|nr:diphthine methyl ester synthase [Nomia melanderi]XP_031825391.1 diphthine methyl ester synthase [Nomia melanderi]
MLYIIGLGLGDVKDVTVKGLEIIRKCDRVYLESYTSILSTGLEELEKFYGCSVLEADRELVESNSDEILPRDEEENVAFLVVGDPFGATTHTDLVLRAQMKGLKFQIVHNASILTAIGCCGLQLYRFGETVSIPYWSDNSQPDSFYDKIVSNLQRNLHTLCLLDIKVKEPTLESLTKKKKVYMPTKFMTVSEAVDQLMQIIRKKEEEKTEEEPVLKESSLVVGLSRVGWDDQSLVACSLGEMSSVNLGPPLHCLIITAPELHALEDDFLNGYRLQGNKNGTMYEINT